MKLIRFLLCCYLFCYFSCFLSQSYADKMIYTVQKKDTLYKISKKHHVDVHELAQVNNIKDPNKLHIGQQLVIPVYRPVQEPEVTIIETASLQEGPREIITTEDYIEYEETSKPARKEPKRNHIIGGSVSYWFSELDAELQVSGVDFIGTDINLEDDLGVDTSKGVVTYNVWLQPISRLRLSVYYTPYTISGSKSISEEIKFGDFVYPLDTNVRGDLDVDRLSVVIELNVLQGKWGYIGGVIGGDYFHLEAELNASEIGRAKATYDTGALTVGVKGAIYLPYNFSIEGQIRGLAFDISDVDLKFFDMEATVSYTILDHFRIGAGYRYWLVDVSVDEDSGELHLRGPIVIGELKF